MSIPPKRNARGRATQSAMEAARAPGLRMSCSCQDHQAQQAHALEPSPLLLKSAIGCKNGVPRRRLGKDITRRLEQGMVEKTQGGYSFLSLYLWRSGTCHVWMAVPAVGRRIQPAADRPPNLSRMRSGDEERVCRVCLVRLERRRSFARSIPWPDDRLLRLPNPALSHFTFPQLHSPARTCSAHWSRLPLVNQEPARVKGQDVVRPRLPRDR